MKIVQPLLGRLTQGSLFTCAAAENYPACTVHGLVITARCDLEQDKYPILNYLPVVALDDWLQVDGFDLLYSRLESDANAALKSILRECDISESILLSQTLESIATAFFSEPYRDKQHKVKAQRYSEIAERISTLGTINRSHPSAPSRLYAINEKASAALLKELSLQRLSGFYFLPSVYDVGDESGYVILLREVKHLSRATAIAVAGGLDSTGAKDSKGGSELSFNKESFAMPIGEIPSPNVEHILQTFSQLFGRIGIEDLPVAYIDQITTRRPRSAGAQ